MKPNPLGTPSMTYAISHAFNALCAHARSSHRRITRIGLRWIQVLMLALCGAGVAHACNETVTTTSASPIPNGWIVTGAIAGNPATLTIKNVACAMPGDQETVITGYQIPSGWVILSELSGTPSNSHIQYADAMPFNHSLVVLSWSPIPTGWAITSSALSGGKTYHYLKNLNGAPYLHIETVLASSPHMSGWVVLSSQGIYKSIQNTNHPNVVTAVISNPSADATVTTGTTVSFASSSTSTPGGSIRKAYWWFGDGPTAVGHTTSHRYVNTGSSNVTYTARLLAVDGSGMIASSTRRITVTPSVPVTVNANIAAPGYDLSIASGTAVEFLGNASASGNTLQSLTWDYGDGSAPYGVALLGAPTSASLSASHTYTNSGSSDAIYTATFSAQGSGGQSSATRRITVTPAPVPVANTDLYTTISGLPAGYGAVVAPVSPAIAGNASIALPADGVSHRVFVGVPAGSYTLSFSPAYYNGIWYDPAASTLNFAMADADLSVSMHYSQRPESAAPPTLTSQPQSQAVVEGAAANFNVGIGGTELFSCQWYRNGVAIAGADATSYTTPALTVDDSGAAYAVVVGNAAGSVTSNSAIVTVTASGGGDVQAPIVSGLTVTRTSRRVLIHGQYEFVFSYRLVVNASDDVGVDRVEFQLDGIGVGTDTTSPYSMSLGDDYTGLGPTMVKAIAFDAAGNAAEMSISYEF